jgi:NAD+ diphosphatase
VYPRTDAVVITLVQTGDGQRVLLGRGAAFPPRFYSCLAGFVEPGESLEEAAAREVREEAGVAVTHVTYFGSQPWPLGRGVFGQVMVAFTATAADGAATPPLAVDATELEDARWVTRAEVAGVLQRWYGEGAGAGAGAGAGGGDGDGGAVRFVLPGPFAIAHQLLKAWARGEVPPGGAAPRL